MRKEQVSIGKVYAVKVSGKVVPVRITREASSILGGWYGTNTITGREVRIRTAGKLRREIAEASISNSNLTTG